MLERGAFDMVWLALTLTAATPGVTVSESGGTTTGRQPGFRALARLHAGPRARNGPRSAVLAHPSDGRWIRPASVGRKPQASK